MKLIRTLRPDWYERAVVAYLFLSPAVIDEGLKGDWCSSQSSNIQTTASHARMCQRLHASALLYSLDMLDSIIT